MNAFLAFKSRPSIIPQNEQIWNTLNISRVQFHHQTAAKHIFDFFNQLGLKVTLKLAARHNNRTPFLPKITKEKEMKFTLLIPSLFIKGHAFYAGKEKDRVIFIHSLK